MNTNGNGNGISNGNSTGNQNPGTGTGANVSPTPAAAANANNNPNPAPNTAPSPSVNMNISELETKTKEELMEMAKEKGMNVPATLKKHDIIMRLLETHTEKQGNIFCSGILEIMADGYGFLRQETLLPSQTDVYISPVTDTAFRPAQRRYGYRAGPAAQEQ